MAMGTIEIARNTYLVLLVLSSDRFLSLHNSSLLVASIACSWSRLKHICFVRGRLALSNLVPQFHLVYDVVSYILLSDKWAHLDISRCYQTKGGKLDFSLFTTTREKNNMQFSLPLHVVSSKPHKTIVLFFYTICISISVSFINGTFVIQQFFQNMISIFINSHISLSSNG